MSHKHCPYCLTRKPLDEFGFNRSKHDGRQNYCRPCSRAVSRLAKAETRRKAVAEQPNPYGDREFFVRVNMMWRPTA